MSRTRIPPAFPWHTQARQYERSHPPGIVYFIGPMPPAHVDCLLYYGDDCQLWGILNHYPIDFPPYEKAGAVNIYIDPKHTRKGVATALLDEAKKRWKIDLDKQRYTDLGAKFIKAYEARK